MFRLFVCMMAILLSASGCGLFYVGELAADSYKAHHPSYGYIRCEGTVVDDESCPLDDVTVSVFYFRTEARPASFGWEYREYGRTRSQVVSKAFSIGEDTASGIALEFSKAGHLSQTIRLHLRSRPADWRFEEAKTLQGCPKLLVYDARVVLPRVKGKSAVPEATHL